MLFLRLLKESALFAVNALRVNKLRTFLSLLGISIGIFTIITVFTIVDSLERNLTNSVEKLGDKVLYVQKWPWVFGGDFPWWKYFNRPNPSYREYEELQKRMQHVDAICFQISMGNKVVKYKSNSVENIGIIAGSHDFDKVQSMEFERGRYLSATESRSGRNYAIIGFSVAEGLFGTSDPIGKDIKVLGRKVKVIGVLKKEGSDLLNTSMDENVFIPINFARNLVDTRSDRYNPMIIVKGFPNADLNEVSNELKGAMRSIRRLSPREEDDFALNQSSMLTIQLQSLFGVVNMAGWIIGGFSILVGGFGIANIMFVSVKERTNIIGIQKSLGAKNYFILFQFLFESIVLCLIGGIIGLLVVYLITLAAGAAGFTLVMTMGNVILGLSVSVIIGTVSGFMPAFSASQLDPVEAIRSK
jgi:putative ABC transport system permease protein